LGYRKIGQQENSATKNKRVGKKGNKKLMSELTPNNFPVAESSIAIFSFVLFQLL